MIEFRAPTRRSLLLMLGAAIAAVGATTTAQARTSKAAAAYRGAPNGRQSCANCSYFNAPSGCGVVSGPVSARGWCKLWG
ncbi:MAG: high-potential iron-sulfur protein [Methylocystis sp.]|nr:high-potential iron-sulfur protein [Methylocystis sp.]